jgi:hypothetical protein
MYMISVPAYLLARVNPVWIFKIMGPILYGTMIWSLFRFLRIGLRWPDERALGGALLTSLYFVTLRISWDLYRNMLGLTFILLSLPLLQDRKSLRNQAILSTLIALAVASDQLTGVIVLVLVGGRGLIGLMTHRWKESIRVVGVAAPGAGIFLAIVYSWQLVVGKSVVRPQVAMPFSDTVYSSVGFLGYAYLALIPLIVLGLGRVSSTDLRSWTIFCIGAVGVALVPLPRFPVDSYRWSLLVDIPLCIYAAAGLAGLASSFHSVTSGIRRASNYLLPLFSTAMLVSAALYIAIPSQSAMTYYALFPALLPTSMIQDTVPSSDMVGLMLLLNSAASRMDPGTVLITHQAIYGWARAYLPTLSHRIVNYEYSSPLEGVKTARSEGFSSILMIWWVNGTGWHDQPNVPGGFGVLQQVGELALYNYY